MPESSGFQEGKQDFLKCLIRSVWTSSAEFLIYNFTNTEFTNLVGHQLLWLIQALAWSISKLEPGRCRSRLGIRAALVEL